MKEQISGSQRSETGKEGGRGGMTTGRQHGGTECFKSSVSALLSLSNYVATLSCCLARCYCWEKLGKGYMRPLMLFLTAPCKSTLSQNKTFFFLKTITKKEEQKSQNAHFLISKLTAKRYFMGIKTDL